MLRHLYSNQQAYGDNDVWCGTDDQYKPGEVDSVGYPYEATCLECLSAAHRYGQECIVRKNELLDAVSRGRNA